MLKEIIKRGLLGFMIGVFVGETILILESINAADGNFYAVSTYLTSNAGSELGAVIVQYLITGILGLTFSAGSIIFEIDRWSLLLQTVVHFAVTSVIMYISGFFCGWFPHTVSSTVIWFVMFIIIYVIFWLSFYNYFKKKTREINESLNK